MRWIIDAQCLQTTSRHRGIGRLAEGLLRELLPLLAQQGVSATLLADDALPPPLLTREGQPTRFFASAAAGGTAARRDLLFRAAILGAEPDVVFVPSPVDEGAITDFASLPARLVAFCHDVIPLVFADHYLADPQARRNYETRIATLKAADFLLANSEATRNDAIRLLGTSPNTIVTVGAGVSDFFRPLDATERPDAARVLRQRFGLEPGAFVLYPGGDEWRKNLEGAVAAFARLAPAQRKRYRLVIACRLSPEMRQRLERLAADSGCSRELVLTDFVSDDELRALYALCALLIFPSRYEGFGLPVAEGMACGAPTAVAANSSLAEMVPDPERQFPTEDPAALAAFLERTLPDDALRARWAAAGPRDAAAFSWKRAARTAVTALLPGGSAFATPQITLVGGRRSQGQAFRIACFSPLPPCRSGIADYCAELAPYIDRRAEVTYFHGSDAATSPTGLVRRPETDFEQEASGFHAALFHMGNSDLHGAMYQILRRYPGVTVLHDYNLTGMLWHLDNSRPDLGIRIERELAHAYGPSRAREIVAGLRTGQREVGALAAQGIYGNRRIFTRSLAVVVHSSWARRQAERDFPDLCPVVQIPLATATLPIPTPEDVLAARQRQGLSANAFVIVAPGFLAQTKRSLPLLDAFARVRASAPDAVLVYAGSDEHVPGGMAAAIQRLGLERHVRVTGFVPLTTFEDLIRAADLCVCLRYPSNGETSAALLRILAQGKPALVTAIGSFDDFGDDLVFKVPPPDRGDEVDEIAAALIRLAADPAGRRATGLRARDFVAQVHDPDRCAAHLVTTLADVVSTREAQRKIHADALARTGAALADGAPETFRDALWRGLAGQTAP